MNTSKPATKNFLGMNKLPARYNAIVMPLILSIFMTSIVSFISTVRGVGIPSNLLTIWLSAWAMSWAVAFPIRLWVMPTVKRATGALVEAP